MSTIKAPFTKEQVDALNKWQKAGQVHPFICSGMDRKIPECERRVKPRGKEQPLGEGILIATTEGWVCPCGKYTQNWAHNFMTNDLP